MLGWSRAARVLASRSKRTSRSGSEATSEGSVRKAGDRLRITAQLINVADDFHLWSERYDRDLEDIFAIQEEIAQKTVDALRVVLNESDKHALRYIPTVNMEAYNYYLRGRHLFYQLRRPSLETARKMFTRAIELDPSYALAYSGIADCRCWLYMDWGGSGSDLQQAEEACQKALAIAPDLAEAHASLGLAISLAGRYEEAEAEFREALLLNSRLYEAHYFNARAFVAQGKLKQAAQLFERACEVRPDDYQAHFLLTTVYQGLGRTEDSLKASRCGLVLVEKHLELDPNDARALYMGAVGLAKLGERDRALEWARRAYHPDEPIVLYNLACVHAVLGDVETAIDRLKAAVVCGFAHREWLENDSDFHSLKDHPRFQALMKRLE